MTKAVKDVFLIKDRKNKHNESNHRRKKKEDNRSDGRHVVKKNPI